MFSFVVKDWNMEREQDENGTYRITGYTLKSSSRYTVECYPGRNLIAIQREKDTSENDPPRRWPGFEKKIIKVIPDFEYCYKLQKTQIRARGGAEGLYNFIKKETERDPVSFFARKIVEYAMDEMREARTA